MCPPGLLCFSPLHFRLIIWPFGSQVLSSSKVFNESSAMPIYYISFPGIKNSISSLHYSQQLVISLYLLLAFCYKFIPYLTSISSTRHWQKVCLSPSPEGASGLASEAGTPHCQCQSLVAANERQAPSALRGCSTRRVGAREQLVRGSARVRPRIKYEYVYVYVCVLACAAVPERAVPV